jgi:hypothetical protein
MYVVPRDRIYGVRWRMPEVVYFSPFPAHDSCNLDLDKIYGQPLPWRSARGTTTASSSAILRRGARSGLAERAASISICPRCPDRRLEPCEVSGYIKWIRGNIPRHASGAGGAPTGRQPPCPSGLPSVLKIIGGLCRPRSYLSASTALVDSRACTRKHHPGLQRPQPGQALRACCSSSVSFSGSTPCLPASPSAGGRGRAARG